MIDLTQHEGFIYSLMRKHKIPHEEHEERFQDFAAHFYAYYKESNNYKPTTIIGRMFHQFLTEQARHYKTEKYFPEKAYEHIQKHNSDWLDFQIGPLEDSQEDFVICEELFSKMSSDLQDYVLFIAQGPQGLGKHRKNSNSGNPVYIISERDGVTRQAVEKRLKRELNKLREE